jgi:histidinol phosphatase-like enzyme
VLAQDVGSKAACIQKMLTFGYDPKKVVMVGDAPGDYQAAKQNGVYYYPILVGKEKESWEEFISTALPKLLDGTYASYGEEKLSLFYQNLGG